MSLPDDYVSEMIARHQIDDATAEALLAGRAVSAELRPLAEVVRTYRRMARQPVRPSAALARQMAAGTFDGSPEHYQPAGATGRGRRRRERRVAPRAALVVVLGGAAAAVAGVTSAGFAGVLPEAAQERFENVVETVTPYEFPQPAGEEAEFGEEVSEDARDGGVDGDEVSDRAREQGEDRRPDELPTVAPGQPGEPSSGPAPADQVVPTPPPPGSGTVPTPPVEERRPITPPGDNQS